MSAVETHRIEDVEFSLCDPDASLVREAVPGHPYEPAATAILTMLLGRGKATFVDIGALYGYFAIYVARLNPGCEVFAFEPNPGFAEVLRRNVTVNGVDVRCEEVALSDTPGTLFMREKAVAVPAARGAASLRSLAAGAASSVRRIGNRRGGHASSLAVAPALSHSRVSRRSWVRETLRHAASGLGRGSDPVGVEALTYDEWARRRGVRATVAKVDVHGAEGMVLAGMSEALRRDLQHVLIEVHAPGMLLSHDYRQLLGMLTEAGLSVYEVDDFRTAQRPVLTKLEGDHLRRFVDPAAWTLKELTLMRMLLASRDDDLRWLGGGAGTGS